MKKKNCILWVAAIALTSGFVNYLAAQKKIIVRDTERLQQLIAQRMKEYGNNANLNDLDVSSATDMGWLFYRTKFNGDTSN